MTTDKLLSRIGFHNYVNSYDHKKYKLKINTARCLKCRKEVIAYD